MKIGFIGLGIMGALIALHLVNAGHQLFVNTRGRVPDTPDVEAALFGASGVAAGLLDVAAMVAYTSSGSSALRMARERPRVPIIGMTPKRATARRLALGCRPVFDDVDPKVDEAIDHILARAKAYGVVAGIHNGTAEGALARIAKGFQFVTVSSDARLMAVGAQQMVAKMRARQAPLASGIY